MPKTYVTHHAINYRRLCALKSLSHPVRLTIISGQLGGYLDTPGRSWRVPIKGRSLKRLINETPTISQANSIWRLLKLRAVAVFLSLKTLPHPFSFQRYHVLHTRRVCAADL